MLPSDGPMQVIIGQNKKLLEDSQNKSTHTHIQTQQHNDCNKSMIKWRRLSDLQSIGASQKEMKRNNLVNDSINGDFLQSIEKEEKKENH